MRLLYPIALLLLQAASSERVAANDEGPHSDLPTKTVFERVSEAPDDVEDFIVRRAGCNHWWGEVAGEPQESDPQLQEALLAREAQIQGALEELDCHSLDEQAAHLKSKYASDETLLALMRETADAMGWPADHP